VEGAVAVQVLFAGVAVRDFAVARAWYERLFGRAPDRRPMATCAEWQLTDGGSVQVIRTGGTPGGSTVVPGVADVDATAAELTGRGFEPEVFTTPDGQFRLASLPDPSGNMVILGQRLTD